MDWFSAVGSGNTVVLYIVKLSYAPMYIICVSNRLWDVYIHLYQRDQRNHACSIFPTYINILKKNIPSCHFVIYLKLRKVSFFGQPWLHQLFKLTLCLDGCSRFYCIHELRLSRLFGMFPWFITHKIPLSATSFVFRLFPKDVLAVCKNIGKKPPNFNDAALITEQILDSGFNFEVGTMYYNVFK